MSTPDRNGWISFDDALAHTGRSPATLRRAVASGKISKRMIPVPGRRPEPELSREDLERVFGRPVHTLTMSEPAHLVSESDQTAVAKLQQNDAISALAPALAKLGEAAERRAALAERRAEREELGARLAWTTKEAARMTGLSRPALGELAEAHPECVIRRGRRLWFRANQLRSILS